jgi:hypothetical protein
LSETKIHELNACNAGLAPSYLRWLMDRCGEKIRFRGHRAQYLAYDRLMFLIASQELPKELNEDAAYRFGLYPSRFDPIETDQWDFVEAVLDGKVVGRIRCLAVPVEYAARSAA